MIYTISLFTKIGWVVLQGDEKFIKKVEFKDDKPMDSTDVPSYLLHIKNELNAYFQGKTNSFDFEVNPEGTDFQKRVWGELTKIPFGKTISYLELSKRLGDVKSIRAAAHANSKNPIAILIPCHRVIGKDGGLTGYAGGLHRKKFLLELEKGISSPELF